MKDINKYRGIIPAFYACYAPDGSISTEGVKALTRHLIAKGVKGVYVGGSSGECIYQHPDERKAVETDEVLAAEIENDPKRFLRFPTKYEIHEHRIMEDFIEQLSPGKVQSDLSYSIRGKGAFRRFKESIRYHGLEQQWYDCLEKAYRDIAVRWCTEEGLAYSG